MLQENIQEFIQKNLKIESLSKIQLGQGVVGKTSPIFLAAMLAIALIGFSATALWVKCLALIAAISLPVYYLHTAIGFAEKNPGLALMEGATLYAWKKTELEAKGLPRPPQQPMVQNPTPTQPSLPRQEPREDR